MNCRLYAEVFYLIYSSLQNYMETVKTTVRDRRVSVKKEVVVSTGYG